METLFKSRVECPEAILASGALFFYLLKYDQGFAESYPKPHFKLLSIYVRAISEDDISNVTLMVGEGWYGVNRLD